MFLESITIDPTGKYLYSGDGVSQTIIAFAINTTSGALGTVTGSPFSTCNNPTGISADPSDKYLYVACGGLSAVWGYSIDPTSGVLTKSAQVGALDSLTGITINGGGAPVTFASHAYVANASDQTISVFNIDPSQHTLIANGTASVSGPTSLVVDALGKRLYSANFMGSSITRDAVQTDGTLSSPQQLVLQNPGFFPEGLVIDASRRWLFVPENSGYLGIFNIDASSGLLTPNTASSNVGIFPIGGNPVAAAIQPNGQTIYIADFSANVIDAYGIDADTGAVNPAFKQPFTAGTNPTALAIDPTGSFLYAANFGSNDISAYVISPNNNNLVAISANVPVGSKPAALIVDGSGTYLYVANQGNGTISAFKIDPASGALTPVANSPFPGVTTADAISLDATGQYLYITSQSANTATTYKINGSDGSLTFLSTVGTGSQPRAIVTDTTIQ